MRGMKTVFTFTLARQTQSRGWRGITIALCLLLFLLPAVIMPCVACFGGNDPIPEPGYEEDFIMEPETPLPLHTVPDTIYVADETGTDLSFLQETEGWERVRLEHCLTLDDAIRRSAGQETALIVSLTEGELNVLLPDGSALTESDGWDLTSRIANGIIPPPEQTEEEELPYEASDPLADTRELLSYLLPYVNIMLIYFLVLFYGQGVANSVILEKTSKLMDTFLVSVKPRAMIFGKVFAIWLGSVIQFLLWVASLVAGFAVGTALVKAIDPGSSMEILLFFDYMGSISGVFSPMGAVIAILMILAGFLLYCAIAAIGGALAGKPEDLSSTNILFTLVLIVSFFCTLQSGFLSGEVASGVGWMDFVPFTAILITPSRILLANVPVWAGLAALGLTVLLTALLLLLAGKLYSLMSLYKGNLPKPRQILRMLKNK